MTLPLDTALSGAAAHAPVRRTPRSWALAALFAAALLTGAWAWWLIAWPVVTLEARGKHPAHFPIVYLHMAGGTVMLAVGAASLWVGWTRRAFRHHRRLGYTYLAGGTVGAGTALVLALANTHEEPPVPFGFEVAKVSDVGIALAALSLAWFAVTGLAFRAARNRRFDAHRGWMVRSYVLTWSFVLCRLVERVPAVSSLGDGSAAVWLSWIVPLLAADLALRWPETSSRPAAPAPASATRG
jgi:hypothetical protein